MYKKYIIVLFSGGIDSTGLLFKLLNEHGNSEDVSIIAHYVNIPSTNFRGKAEKEAVRKVVKYCHKRYSNFEFSSSTFAYSFQTNKAADVVVVSFYGAYVARNVFGRHMQITGEEPIIEVTRGANASETAGPALVEKRLMSQQVFYGFLLGLKRLGYNGPELVLPAIDMTHEDLYKLIPDELKGKTWSCRGANEIDGEYVPCGVCIPCHKDKEMGVI